ncbi:helix-turn-helix domain-containing protein [Leptospira saintgironsiae]|uniref:AraC family transcriptional regulator n=1 Tax=Leptospira saintgironsiae TaxID=2023183 RepID=A0A2M9Y8Y3_9LEPT|nr:helix-turn-helix transcriptional regulator [Leptospira saintgironsiae]PJZ48031.1 AraC family transcriptional regulator [Leptospira saintgironsiae]
MSSKNLVTINSVSEFHEIFGYPKPAHPLISITQLKGTNSKMKSFMTENRFMYDFYTISIKRNIKGSIKYGRQSLDFREGIMGFSSPKQIFSFEDDIDISELSGWYLIFHTDLIRNYDIARRIKSYGFFSYEVNEALHLSEKEESIIDSIMNNIQDEYLTSIDSYSQDLIVSQIELLIQYANRFYNRQFITRKNMNQDLLFSLEKILEEYYISSKFSELGIPTVKYISFQLSVSPNYLSDMLRNLTGYNTQQHIHNWIIEKAKEKLSTTSLSVNEISLQLGFEYPQYFSRLFKTKTKLSPMEFRNSFE